MSNILVISTSLRARSNSDILAESLIAGARDAGNEVRLSVMQILTFFLHINKNVYFCNSEKTAFRGFSDIVII